MISPETIRMYSFFSGLTNDDIIQLANAAEFIDFEPGEYLVHENDPLTHFYIVVEGKVAVTTKVPDPEKVQQKSKMLTGETLETKEIQTSTVGSGQVFAWSAMVPPYSATANVKGLTKGKAIRFDSVKLRQAFKSNPRFGYLMLQKAAEILRNRMKDMRTESLLCIVK